MIHRRSGRMFPLTWIVIYVGESYLYMDTAEYEAILMAHSDVTNHLHRLLLLYLVAAAGNRLSS